MAKFGFDAFLSYTSHDNELAFKILDWLRASGFKIWFDKEQIILGTSFRAALESGLRASRHLIALITPAYITRHWTQRELDLFDLTADRSRRRMLGIQVGDIEEKKIDQVFRVYQRVTWKGDKDNFDPAAFWQLVCGLRGEPSGAMAEWANKGTQLVSAGSMQPGSAPPLAQVSLTSHQLNTKPKAIRKPNNRPGISAIKLTTEAPTSEGNGSNDLQSSPVKADKRRSKGSELAQRSGVPPLALAEWACVGPTNIGGRAMSVVCHPARHEIVWLGTAGGGVWKSDDGGKSWRYLWNRQDSLSIGSLAIDSLKPDTLYCGTGGPIVSERPGVGLFRSLNGGDTWTLLGSVDKDNLPTRICAIAVDPCDSKHIRVGGITLWEGELAGMHVSRDGGRTWMREKFLSEFSHSCPSIVFHPKRQGVVFATFVEPGFQSGIWRSIDGGKSWKHLEDGLPSADSLREVNLAIAPSKPDVIYAIANDFAVQGVRSVFVSDDMGSNWRLIGGLPFKNDRGMINAIAVHPEDHRYVICGDVDLHRTTDGGKIWRQVTHWDDERGDPQYAHWGHNALLMPVTAPGLIYDANEGGMEVSENGGKTWVNRSSGLVVTPFYKIAVAPSDSRVYGGGTESNGVVVTTTGRPDDHFELLSGEAGVLVFDPEDASHLFASSYNLDIWRGKGSNFKDVSPPAPQAEKETVWCAVITMDPRNAKSLFTGSNRVWRTKNDGGAWVPVSKSLDGSTISAIEVAKANPKRIYVGTQNGGVFRSLDGGDSWSNNIAGASLPKFMVTCIRSSPIDADIVFASFGNFGRSHVFRSDDGGKRWIDIDKGALPDVPHSSLVIPDDKPGTVYVCNNVGVFVSDDLGNQWKDMTGNLPNTPVMDLIYHEAEGALFVGTWGRSIWRMQVA